MIKVKFLIILCCTPVFVFSQATRKMKTEKANGAIVEKYTVLKPDELVRHGSYELIFQKKTLRKGSYANGQKSGNWFFGNPGDEVYFTGTYLANRKHGEWIYFLKGSVICKIYYNSDKLDSLFSYFDNGSISKEMRLDDLGNGTVLNYYSNGQLAEKIPIKGFIINGNYERYYTNGQAFQRMEYLHDRPLNLFETYNAQGQIMDVPSLKNGTGTFVNFYLLENDKTQQKEIFTYKDSVLNGPYSLYDDKGIIKEEGTFADGNQINPWLRYSENKVDTIFHQPVENPIPFTLPEYPANDKLYYRVYTRITDVEQMPEFSGKIENLMAFLSANIIYPPGARNAGIQGMVYINFVINETGEVIDSNVLRSVSSSIDEEAMRVVNILPPWSPGFNDGVPVQVQFNLPIRMTLR